MTGKAHSRARSRTGILAKLLIVCALLELTAYAAGRVLQSKWAMYRDPIPEQTGGRCDYETYLKIRDGTLGWPSPREYGSTYDADGTRRCLDSGVAPDARWTLSLYGDSFTADWVGEDTDSWGCRLQRLTGTRVENWGVGGYGTDQALLRYLGNPEDRAELVVLSHMSAGIIRNVTRYRDFEVGTQDWAFKPRFAEASDGALESIGIPTLSAEDYERFIDREGPQLFLEHEFLHPNGPTGAVRLTFPYTWSLLRNLRFEGLSARLAGQSRHALYYRLEHGSGALAVTAGILKLFASTAEARGQRSLIVVFPDRSDLDRYFGSGTWVYQPLLDELERAGLTPLNVGDAFVKRYDSSSISKVFGTGGPRETYHYGIEGSHFVADTVLECIRERGLLDL
jgi:hypothetical protein